MNRRLLLQLSGPAAMVGFLLLAVSLASAWSIHRLQSNLVTILAEDVTGLEAAEELVILFRRLRYHILLSLLEPRPLFQELIEKDHEEIERGIKAAWRTANSDAEFAVIKQIEESYAKYRQEIETGPRPATTEPRDLLKWLEEHRVHPLSDLCYELVRINKKLMEDTAAESDRVAEQTRLALLLLGILGPIGGLIIGYAVAKTWSRSITRLSVRLNDMHAHLEKDLGVFQLGSDFQAVDRQLDRIVERVKGAADQMQRQQSELLRTKQLAAVGQLAAGVAHEIRNPLTAIKMLLGAALRPRNPQPPTEADMKVMYDEVGKLELTVQTLLDFAKPREIQKQSASLRGILNQAVNLVRPKAQHQNVRISLRTTDDEFVGSVDAAQVGTVFVNLLLNSIDAMPSGGDIAVECAATDSETVTITVSDTGQGVAPEITPRIFDPFASTKATGTGLGLSICQRIVCDHGGSIEYIPRPEGGARFVVTLRLSPLESAHAATAGRR